MRGIAQEVRKAVGQQAAAARDILKASQNANKLCLAGASRVDRAGKRRRHRSSNHRLDAARRGRHDPGDERARRRGRSDHESR